MANYTCHCGDLLPAPSGRPVVVTCIRMGATFEAWPDGVTRPVQAPPPRKRWSGLEPEVPLPAKVPWQQTSPIDGKRALEMYREGLTWVEIGRQLGGDHNSAMRAAKRAGYVPRVYSGAGGGR